MTSNTITSTQIRLVSLGVAAVLVGCGQSGGTPTVPPQSGTTHPEVAVDAPGAVNPLADTDWYLVEFQSMDDTQGTTVPEDPFAYTMRLNADGTVNMRLNCNRANGTWTIEPSADPSNGSFRFSPLATTKALCPPPSMDEMVAAQAEYVRGYMLQGSRLYLSLMADGGIFVWEAQVPFQNEADEAIESAILETTPDYSTDMVGIDDRFARYVSSRIDLNDDGRDEVLVSMLGSIFCGTGGCNLMIFTPDGDGYALVNNFPISREPVIVSAETTNGWSNLVRRESGGGTPPSYVLHTFDGERYVEQDRLPGDAEFEGTRCLTGGFTFDDGVVLEPRD